MRILTPLLLAAGVLAGSSLALRAEVNVVASIKPVHSLVAAVMEGVGTPGLIVDGAGSPHTYALRPSQARMLEKAHVVFWVGHALEAFLEKPLATVAANAVSVELIDAHGLTKLGFREGGAFESHGHDDGHDDHADDDQHHDEAAHADNEHEHDHESRKVAGTHSGEGGFDAHIWLDPENAKAMVHAIEEALVKTDPSNTEKYKANAAAVTARLDQLITEIRAKLEPVKDKRFIVFHDAYQYFENRFGMKAAGSITISPEVKSGAERITQIRAKVRELGAACVFAEPQFEPKLVATVTEGTSARSGVIDPLGSAIENGPDLYFSLVRNMARAIQSCLAEAS